VGLDVVNSWVPGPCAGVGVSARHRDLTRHDARPAWAIGSGPVAEQTRGAVASSETSNGIDLAHVRSGAQQPLWLSEQLDKSLVDTSASSLIRGREVSFSSPTDLVRGRL